MLVPVYLLHRFQVQAVGKLIGGQYFTYTMRGDGQTAPVTVTVKKQQAAIDALINTLDPSVLILPQSVIDIIPPRPPGHVLGRESFSRNTGIMFDPLAPAASSISLTLDVLLNQQRAARLNIFHAIDPELPDFKTILDELLVASWYEERRTSLEGAIQRIKSDQFLNRLMALATDTRTDTQVRDRPF